MDKYISQKAQKIASALYLITDSIKDNDSIKWEIREEGISLVSGALLLGNSFLVDKEHTNRSFLFTSEKIISFLKVAQNSFLISKMNTAIVINELESLVEYINKESINIQLPGYILSDNFFSTDNDDKDNKGQSLSLRTTKTNSESSLVNQAQNGNSQKDRRSSIVNLLKTKSNLSVKDFTKVISGCSEKTIQRELITLVKAGIVKRDGERRWSTYSLV